MARISAEARWSALIDTFERSGLSAADFCQQRTLNPQTFAWYRSRLRKQRPNTLPVPVVPAFVGDRSAAPVARLGSAPLAPSGVPIRSAESRARARTRPA